MYALKDFTRIHFIELNESFYLWSIFEKFVADDAVTSTVQKIARAHKDKCICRTMEDVAVNGMKEVNSSGDGIYYDLDGEGDADSSTTPGHNVDHHRDRKYYQLLLDN